MEALPSESTGWVFVRPAEIFQHPQLGRALGRAVDDAGDQALFERARRHGYDLRTLPRAMMAWRPGASLAVGLGPLDTARINTLLWDRLLTPRTRHDLGDGASRMVGHVGATRVALATHGRCGVAAWSEGEPGWVEAALPVARAADDGGTPQADPEVLVHWEETGVPEVLRGEGEAGVALSRRVRRFVLEVGLRPTGLGLSLRLQGPLPDDTAARLEAAVVRFRQSNLGGAIGADVWLTGAAAPRVVVEAAGEPGEGEARMEAAVPWSGVEALADVIRGRVGP